MDMFLSYWKFTFGQVQVFSPTLDTWTFEEAREVRSHEIRVMQPIKFQKHQLIDK